MKRAAFFAAALAALALPAAARAEPDQAERADGHGAPEVLLGIGARGLLLPNAGYEPYSSNELMFQLALTGGLTILQARDVALIAFAEWDWGTTSADARAGSASLAMHRFAGGLEARFGLGRRLFLSVKAAPAAIYLPSSIQEPSSNTTLTAHPWTWALDTTGSLGVMLGSVKARRAPVRFWLGAEVGYSFAGAATMAFTGQPQDSTDTRTFGAVMLPAFRPSGGVSRLFFNVTF
jgi:hypothetical protein